MSHHYQVVPECYADTLLVEMLGIKKPNHVLNSNINYVLERVKKSRPGQKVVGIIDSDRGKSEKFLDGFKLIEERHNIKKYARGKHTILVVCPAFEGWVFKVAADENVEPAKYGFDSKKKFANECKRHDVKRNERVKNFLGLLKQKKSPGFTQLKTWICEGAGIDEKDL
ncbi:MAG: hypothetical protein IPJ82_08090 [Lewinellaceae bacterium]|nr:hypothetical protein [Lewinellaceae bacterium]